MLYNSALKVPWCWYLCDLRTKLYGLESTLLREK